MTAPAPSYLDSILPHISAWTAPTMPGSVTTGYGASPVTSANLPGSQDFLTRLFGGADTSSAGILSPEDMKAARNAALFHTGLSILANSGPAPYRRGLGEILANGVLAGQQDYQQESQRILASKGAAFQQGQMARMADIAQRYSGKVLDVPTLQSLMSDLAANGEAGPASAVSQYLSNLTGAGTKGMQVKSVNTPGQPGYDPKLPAGSAVIHIVDPTNPSQILATYPGEPSATAGYESALTQDRMLGIMQRERDSFVHQHDYSKLVQTYNVAKAGMAEAADNPEAYKTALFGFINASDSRPQMRVSLLKMLQNVDPSFKGTLEQMWDKVAGNGFPPGFLQNMNQIVDHIFTTHAQTYENARRGELRRHASWKDYGSYLPTTSEIFPGTPGQTAEGIAPTAGGVDAIMGGQ